MISWQYHNPVAVRFGAGTVEQLPGVLGGRDAVLVTFPEAQATGLEARVASLLGRQLREVVRDVQPNPDVAWLRARYASIWKRHGGCTLVAMGGGSAIDTAKLLQVATPAGDVESLLAALAAGGQPEVRHAFPLVAIPTTAGTGSEVTPWATVWDRTPGVMKKYSLHLKETWPEAAIVDPELVISLPAGPTLAAGLDALSHALESIWNVNSNPISDTHAVAAAREVIATLPLLMKDLKNAELRTRMSLAALKAGLAFSNTKTALAHSISYDMTLHHGLPHGIACSFTLPMVLGRAVGVDAKRDAVLQQVFDMPLSQAPAFLGDFLRGLGVSTDFASYGVGAEEAQRMVVNALDGVRGKNFIGAGIAA